MNKTRKAWEKVTDMISEDYFSLGPVNSEVIIKDTKHFLFTLARYKFAAKMLVRSSHIIEVGCGEGLGILSFLSETKAKVTGLDFDAPQIAYDNKNIIPHAKGRATFACHDFVNGPYKGVKGDGLVCLDVIEHIHAREQDKFLTNTCATLKQGGVAIFGTPNQDAQQYASARSKVGHINLFDADRLEKTLGGYFSHVFMFSMNDEMVHTGYKRMAHYLMALCIK
ncbi:MAG: class I SAM-dependent methyltransferase [Candidatus Omnitrophica bacterium]|nr:class I SAM-dependent methyltransferase [Candidatus Omnitrophota bacterium]